MENRSTAKIHLESSIGELPLSDGLKKFLQDRGYKKLSDVLAKQIPLIRRDEGMSFEQELELFRVVKDAGLRDHWKE
jgi:hypothetical protein